MSEQIDKSRLYLSKIETKREDLAELMGYLSEDFPRGHAHPHFIIRSALKRGVLKGVYLTDGEEHFAYCLFQDVPALKALYIMYIAVRADYRSAGLGGFFLDKIGDLAQVGIFLEVEDPETPKDYEQEHEIRRRRIGFYERGGYHLVKDFKFTDNGSPMLLMTNADFAGVDWLKIYHKAHNRFYSLPLGPLVIKKF